MPHRGLSNKRKRVRLRHAVTAHDLQNGGEHNPPGSNTVLQLFDVRGFVDQMVRAGYSAPWGIEVLNGAHRRELPLADVVQRAYTTTRAQFAA